MGTSNVWDPAGGSHPNCTVTVDPQGGDRGSRRIGLATSTSPWGPWTRRDAPIFGPGNRTANEWDWSDVSNVTPIILANGTTVLLYKGRGHVQAMGAASGRAYDGPFQRTRPTAPVLSWHVEDTWGWVRAASAGNPEVLHVLSHVGNGARAAGGHAWSFDGVNWVDTTAVHGGVPAYTGRVQWADGNVTVLERRERPQALLRRSAVMGSGNASGVDSAASDSYGEPEVICTSAQPAACKTDGGPPVSTASCRSFTMCATVAS